MNKLLPLIGAMLLTGCIERQTEAAQISAAAMMEQENDGVSPYVCHHPGG